jgi:hypothetical protein
MTRIDPGLRRDDDVAAIFFRSGCTLQVLGNSVVNPSVLPENEIFPVTSPAKMLSVDVFQ